jgi:hypothetical protein
MSKAKPMGDARRRASYGIGAGTWPTPRQRRRMIHKERKGTWGFGYPDTKGYATYPRAEAIAVRLAGRRMMEDRRDVERCTVCPENDGLIPVDGCNCGSPADESVNYAHERLCGFEPCPNGCWDKLHPEPARA